MLLLLFVTDTLFAPYEGRKTFLYIDFDRMGQEAAYTK